MLTQLKNAWQDIEPKSHAQKTRLLELYTTYTSIIGQLTKVCNDKEPSFFTKQGHYINFSMLLFNYP